MTTALELINDALLEIGIKDEANALTGDQSAHALRVLNRLLGRWASRRLLLPVLSDVSVTLDGSASYTMGPTGADVTTPRPMRIESARLVLNDTEYPVRVLNQQERNAIADKTLTGLPAAVWYEATLTNGTLHVYPIGSSGTLKLNCRAVLTNVVGLEQELTLPSVYEDALVPALADACAASYQIKTPPDVLRRAAAGVAAIKASNAEPLYVDLGLSNQGQFDIQRGY
jgi:hypothetical protein